MSDSDAPQTYLDGVKDRVKKFVRDPVGFSLSNGAAGVVGVALTPEGRESLRTSLNAVIHAAERATEAVVTEVKHVTGHDKPLDTPPAAPAASAKDTPAKGK
jgi:hypothetical protein